METLNCGDNQLHEMVALRPGLFGQAMERYASFQKLQPLQNHALPSWRT